MLVGLGDGVGVTPGDALEVELGVGVGLAAAVGLPEGFGLPLAFGLAVGAVLDAEVGALLAPCVPSIGATGVDVLALQPAKQAALPSAKRARRRENFTIDIQATPPRKMCAPARNHPPAR
jgi:hypothetical protein